MGMLEGRAAQCINSSVRRYSPEASLEAESREEKGYVERWRQGGKVDEENELCLLLVSLQQFVL